MEFYAEIWLPVTGWEGLYEVSDAGRVRSLDRITTTRCAWSWCCGRDHEVLRRGRILGGGIDPGGYRRVRLSRRKGEYSTRPVHVLVLEAFEGPCPPGMETLHGPGGPADNRWPENIRWGTKAQNELDKLRDGTLRFGSRQVQAKLTEDIVRECRARHAAGEGVVALGREFGVTYQAIQNAISGKRWQHVT